MNIDMNFLNPISTNQIFASIYSPPLVIKKKKASFQKTRIEIWKLAMVINFTGLWHCSHVINNTILQSKYEWIYITKNK